MRALIQRSKESTVEINGKVHGKISKGLVVLVCFTEDDNETDIDYIIKKITNLRIFDDENGIMNKSAIDINGSILSISQFTLYAITSEGNRPSYIRALKGEESSKLYDLFNEKLSKLIEVQTGVFGADMLCHITNDGPVTIMLDSKNKKM